MGFFFFLISIDELSTRNWKFSSPLVGETLVWMQSPGWSHTKETHSSNRTIKPGQEGVLTHVLYLSCQAYSCISVYETFTRGMLILGYIPLLKCLCTGTLVPFLTCPKPSDGLNPSSQWLSTQLDELLVLKGATLKWYKCVGAHTTPQHGTLAGAGMSLGLQLCPKASFQSPSSKLETDLPDHSSQSSLC